MPFVPTEKWCPTYFLIHYTLYVVKDLIDSAKEGHSCDIRKFKRPVLNVVDRGRYRDDTLRVAKGSTTSSGGPQVEDRKTRLEDTQGRSSEM